MGEHRLDTIERTFKVSAEQARQLHSELSQRTHGGTRRVSRYCCNLFGIARIPIFNA